MDGKVSLDNADPSGYNDPSSVDFSEDYKIRRGVDDSSSNSGAEDLATYTATIPDTPLVGVPIATSKFLQSSTRWLMTQTPPVLLSEQTLTPMSVSSVEATATSALISSTTIFVHQLNIYGFHKINCTSYVQYTSTNVQAWCYGVLEH